MKENNAAYDTLYVGEQCVKTDVDKRYDKYAHGAPGQSPEIDLPSTWNRQFPTKQKFNWHFHNFRSLKQPGN